MGKMRNKVKEFFKGYGEIFTTFYDDLANGTPDGGVEIIQHFLAWVGTAALTMGTVAAISAGAAVPAVLLGLGTAALATDECVHIAKKESSFITRSITKILSAILAPPLLAVIYPIAVAGVAISNTIKEHRSERQERRANKEHVSDYTHEYDASVTHESTVSAEPIAPTVEANHTGPDFSNYYLEGEPHAESVEHIEELEESSPRLQPPTSDDDPLNYD